MSVRSSAVAASTARWRAVIDDLYPQAASHVCGEIESLIDRYRTDQLPVTQLWSERDIVLITYADQIRQPGSPPLAALRDFLLDHGLADVLSCVHLLPFFPYSSDDGFSVIDYMQIDPEAGDWQDVQALGEHFELMFDLVVNHCSQHHAWFQGYLKGDIRYQDYFIDVDPKTDLSAVVRPRSLPLLTPFETQTGRRHVWTTFSEDQVDLNYASPAVLLGMLRILLEYARRGARIIRLDAIAFLWKRIGTSSLHLPETHAVVRLMRSLLEICFPGTILLTETNVPHRENISYFGDGDEAQMVYQFSLPPLLLDAIHNQDTQYLSSWLNDAVAPHPNTTFFNFTASHDGIGVRPLEGIVPEQRIGRLVDIVKSGGGRVSMRRRPDGSESPYELNITYLDAVADRSTTAPEEHVQRFMATQAIMLGLAGIPGIYFHSLVGSPNDTQGVVESGHNRRINRHKYDRDELAGMLAPKNALPRRVFDSYRRLLGIRMVQPAFHPDSLQEPLTELPTDGLFGFLRTAAEGQRILVLANLSARVRSIDSQLLPAGNWNIDLLDDLQLWSDPTDDAKRVLHPFQVRWLVDEE